MKISYSNFIFQLLLIHLLIIATACTNNGNKTVNENETPAISENMSDHINVNLPEPSLDGNSSLESVLSRRRSVREYKQEPLSIEQLSQLLWAAQGITGSANKRTAPSAGALYPLEVLLSADNVTGLESGIYRYEPIEHKLILIAEGLYNGQLSDAGLGQSAIADAPVCILITAVFDRITVKYGDRGINYAYVEAGHVCQNLLLQAISLDLGAVPIGAFNDRDISELLRLNKEETPIYIIPVGVPK